MSSPQDARFSALGRALEALASPTRLHLLHLLRTPHELSSIRAAPSLSREGERDDRALSRQAVTRHLEVLTGLGLVQRVGEEPSGRGDVFVLDHARLFALVDEMRALARLRPTLTLAGHSGTLARDEGGEPAPVAKPRLAVAYGRDEGVAFTLADAGREQWTIGRVATSDVWLDFDPFVSAQHAVIRRDGPRFVVRDLGSTNGTFVDWRRLPVGRDVHLEPGALLGIGRCVLVLQQ